MPRAIYRDPEVLVVNVKTRNYGFFKFLFDVTMTIISGGFWLIWIFIREMRR